MLAMRDNDPVNARGYMEAARKAGTRNFVALTAYAKLETDPAKASEVHVTFAPQGERRTLVTLEHRHLDRHGEGWEAMRDAVGSGWSLARFAEVASAQD